MQSLNLKALIGRLDDLCRASLEEAADLCVSRTHYSVEIEHFVSRLLNRTDTDLHRLLLTFDVSPATLEAELTRAIDCMKTGNSRPPVLSKQLIDVLRSATLVAELEFAAARVRSGHILLAAVEDGTAVRLLRESCPSLRSITPESIREKLPEVLESSPEDAAAGATVGGASATGPAAKPGSGKALEQFTIDLTQQARDGEIDPIVARDDEIRQVVDILTRRRQNNPILTGEAGVGKTAIVEGLAGRIVKGDVPGPLRDACLLTLDLGLLQAGAGVRGEFENRLRGVIEEVKSSPTPIILFIDEAHTLVGAGGSEGQGDAANLLKPALARGELRTIAATTWAEYKKYFEKDAALTRRFQVVKVEEPTEDKAVEMMYGVAASLESHHSVRILDEAIRTAVKLSNRYISGRQLPEKAVGVLDTACARVALTRASEPAPIEDRRRRLEAIDTQCRVLEREVASGADFADRLDALQADREETETELARLQQQLEDEFAIIDQIIELRLQLEKARQPDAVSGNGSTGDGSTEDSARSLDSVGVQKPSSSVEAKGGTASIVRTISSDDASSHLHHEPGEEEAPSVASIATATSTTSTTNSVPDASSTTAVIAASPETAALVAQLRELKARLAEVQGNEALAHVEVDSEAVAAVVGAWTGIPVGRMVSDEIESVLKLQDRLEERVIGQSHALSAIAQCVRTNRAGLSDPSKPIGVFLFVGTSGIGKTETAIALAELLYGGEQNMTTINMSEFKEEHKVSLLMGSPPGYVGYGEGGVLTEAVRRKPYSVVLLDEMEKAHLGVQDIFYQVFDKGQLRDGQGRDIDFKNTLIIMTSNAASAELTDLCVDNLSPPAPDELAEAIYPVLVETFKPAFLGRLQIIPFYPLPDPVIEKIIHLKLDKIRRRMQEHHSAAFEVDDDVIKSILARCREVQTGARTIDHILSKTLLPELSAEFLSRMSSGERIARARVRVGDSGSFDYELE